jgi:hypothetical protein
MNLYYNVYGGPPLNMVHLRHLMLKTNGEDQNSKRQNIYGTKLRHFIVWDPSENQK